MHLEATTDSLGHYQFSNVDPGDYYVHFDLPGGYAFTQEHQGDPSFDSDADTLSGNTAVFTLHPSEFNLDIDAGLVPV